MKRRWGLWLGVALLAAILSGSGKAWSYIQQTYAFSAARNSARSVCPEEALACLEGLQSAYPENAEIAYLLAVTHRRLGQTSAASADLKRAAQLGWNREDLLRQKYLIDFQSGQIKEAEPHLCAMLADGCADDIAAEIYECLVKGYLSDIRLHEAQMCIDYWLEWRPDSVQAHLLQAEIMNGAGAKAALLREYEKILELNPDNQIASSRRGFLLLHAKDVPGAAEQFAAHLRLWPDDAVVRVGLASCERQRGDIDAAEQEFNRAVAGDLPDNDRAFALAELGQIALGKRDYSRARQCFERSLEVDPNDSTAHYSLAMVLSRCGEKDAAGQHLELSRKLQGQANRLEELLNNVISQPEDVALRCEAGEILLDQGNLKEAFVWLLSALRCERWHAPTHAALARYYDQVGKPEMAQQHLAWARHEGATAITDAGAR